MNMKSKKKKRKEDIESSKSEIGWGHQLDHMFYTRIEW